MERRNFKKVIWVLAVFLLTAVIAISGAVIAVSRDNSGTDIENGAISTTALPTQSNGSFSKFVDGTKYAFTDENKINDFRTSSLDKDYTIVEVDSSATPGSVNNPYVITTVAEWNALASLATSFSATLGKHYALGNDIIANSTMKRVTYFSGYFHGNGYKISNVAFNPTTYTIVDDTYYAIGLFDVTQNATITDLVLDISVTYSATGFTTGGLIGVAQNKLNIYNCQVKSSTNSTEVHNFSGGIIGAVVSGASINIYRTAVNYTYNVTAASNTNEQRDGGMIGCSNGAVNIKILDSTISFVANTGNVKNRLTGGVIGTMVNSTNSNVVVENLVNKVQNTTPIIAYDTCIFHIYNDGTIPKSIMLSNVYTVGLDSIGSTTTSRYLISARNTKISSVRNILTVNNVHTTGFYSRNLAGTAEFGGVDVYTGTNSIDNISSSSQASAENTLWTKAQSDSALPSKIWTNKSAIGTFVFEDSPFSNKLDAQVKFRNLKNGSDESISGITDGTYKVGDILPTPADNNHHVFKGWTTDTSGKSTPFKNLPSGIIGATTLYAVWGLDVNTAADITVTGDGGTHKASAVYGSNLTLQSSVTSTVMTDIQYTLQWKLDGTDINNATQKTYVLQNVKQSGDYTFDYVFYSQAEPLWRGTGSTAQSYDAKITPAPVELKANSFSTTQPAYKGRSYSDSNFKPTGVIVMSSDGVTTVDGTFAWEIAVGIVGSGTQETISGDKVTRKFVFTPDAKYNGNYGTTVTLDGTFELQYVKMKFTIPTFANKVLEANLEYDGKYKYDEVVALFQNEFNTYMTDPNYSGLFDGMTPAFVIGGVTTNINEYKNKTGFAYQNVTSNIEIEVGFVAGEYTVTFDPNNGDAPTTLSAKYKYNTKIYPLDPQPVNGSEMFMGWYYDTGELDDKNAPIYKKWDFENDRVTGDLTLTAQWLAADTLTSIEVKLTGKREIIAGTKLQADDLVVTANFKGEDINGNEITQSMELSWSDYVSNIKYDTRSWDGNLHVYPSAADASVSDAVNVINFKYSFTNSDGVTSSATFDLDVEVSPIDMTDDVHSLNFGQDANNAITMQVDGTAKNLPVLPSSAYSKYNVKGITYEYRNSVGNIVQPEDVKDAGRYTVRVNFEMASFDYDADVLIISLTLAELSDISIEWEYDGSTPLTYNGEEQLPSYKVYDENDNDITEQVKDLLTFNVNGNKKDAGEYTVSVTVSGDYNITGGASLSYKIVKAQLSAPPKGTIKVPYNGKVQNIEDYLKEYIDTNLIEVIGDVKSRKDVGTYNVQLKLKDTNNCQWDDGSIANKPTDWTIEQATLILDWDAWEFVYDGSGFAPRITGIADGLAEGESIDFNGDFIYEIYDADGNKLDVSEVTEMGTYKIVAKPNDSIKNNYKIDEISGQWDFIVTDKTGRTVIRIEWDEKEFTYDGEIHYPKYMVTDKDGNELSESVKNEVLSLLNFSEGYRQQKELGTYSVTVTLKNSDKYTILSGGVCKYRIVDENGYAPSEEETNNRNDDDKKGDGGFTFDNVGQMLKEWWQVIASGVSIILIIIFVAKTISYMSRKKEAKKTADEKYKAYYAAATGLFGLAMNIWTVIACVLMGVAAATFVMMLIAKKGCKKAERELSDSKEEYERNRADAEARRRDEDMKMMFMHMMGGNGNSNGGQGMPQFVQQGIGADEMRGLISETVTALLPGMQQMLPQQASANDELVQKLIEQNEKLMQKLEEKSAEKQVVATNSNDEAIKQLMEQNAQNQKSMQEMMQKLAEKPAEKVVEKEIVAASANDETIKQMLSNQEKLMEKILELSNNQSAQQVVAAQPIMQAQPQVIERVVEKPVEKIVEVPVEKVVEKVVEKPIAVNVTSTEKSNVISSAVEKSKQVKPTPKKEAAPRLTLEEAYAKLTKEQKKYFDGLREYAMKKDSKCKEKLATYFTTIGPSTTNPLIKLTIKKGVTVALFKMEDEYLKDIRRNASSDGTKLKVKETELPVGDSQAFDTAKDMIDLRIDQIERYEDFMKEQRAMKRK